MLGVLRHPALMRSEEMSPHSLYNQSRAMVILEWGTHPDIVSAPLRCSLRASSSNRICSQYLESDLLRAPRFSVFIPLETGLYKVAVVNRSS